MSVNLNHATSLRLFNLEEEVLRDIEVHGDAIEVAKTIFSRNSSVKFLEFRVKQNDVNVSLATVDSDSLSLLLEEEEEEPLEVTTLEPVESIADINVEHINRITEMQDRFLGKLVKSNDFHHLTLKEANELSNMVSAAIMEVPQ